MINSLEKRYRVILPANEKATYSSLMNYSDDLSKPMQRWYRYKEGFSIALVTRLLNEYKITEHATILDPFLGSGSTLVASSLLGLKGIGFEVNPFSYFLSKCKLRNYDKACVSEFKSLSHSLTESAFNLTLDYSLPDLSFANKVFTKEVEEFMMTLKKLIDTTEYRNLQSRDLLTLGWLSCIEELSNYRKAGNGLKIRRNMSGVLFARMGAYNSLKKAYGRILEDIQDDGIRYEVTIHNKSCSSLNKHVMQDSIDGIVFSPPYANCFDYTEIYKLELWFGGFISKYADLKELRKASLRSHLHSKLEADEVMKSTSTLESLLSELSGVKLWDKNIPLMLKLYYSDLFKVIEQCFNVLRDKGFCSIVVGNSAYGGIVFPTDLFVAEFAETIGFIIDKIEVDRYIITSSQQYETTKAKKNFLRESVVCLRKP